jgi:hypothetical protein
MTFVVWPVIFLIGVLFVLLMLVVAAVILEANKL